MDILLVIIIFVVIIFIRKLWIEYKDRENSFRRANQAIDRELLNRKYIESEILLDSGQFKKYTPLMSAIPAIHFSLPVYRMTHLKAMYPIHPSSHIYS